MTISERIFERLNQLDMTQKDFSDKTGIMPSTISEWKKNKTNPSSDKIMSICKALDVTPEWLLSGVEGVKGRERSNNYYVIDKNTDIGVLVERFYLLEPNMRERIIGYAEAILAMTKKDVT
ncbi:Transcriptional regulator, contains XRE-family HTH domain [Butyrivibrio hungatei]|uniref:Transcriptional regulator, contains XRE-family HTH domain n=1 Tax=Butyrivibrio hungatei TaxID=185008 RepID=A0A1G5E2R0_9FIRM|nr:helix-turn-helix transcriptional regulator [Butyrivibrio hungatei]SCY21050.1 Transcriptional regulator, contains XRE-family HTH domain [Butyrivibrio hungatei]